MEEIHDLFNRLHAALQEDDPIFAKAIDAVHHDYTDAKCNEADEMSEHDDDAHDSTGA